MRNLGLKNFEIQKLSSINDCEVFCLDSQVLFAYGKGNIIKYDGSEENIICNLADILYSVEEISKAVDIIYHCEKNLLFLILCNGDIISTGTDSSAVETIVGSVEYGIKFAQWSPDEEVVALVNGVDHVIVLTKDFDTVNEVDLHSSGFGEKPIVSVGWGKKETQFQGSAGKYVPKETSEVMDLAKADNIKISWRGDAQYFAVSSKNPQTALRYLRIFSKNGILQYTSETLKGVEDCLAWRPSGNLIASTQRLVNKSNVCFFEKNGMKHGDFSVLLNLESSTIFEVAWSKDSKILALFVIDSHKNDDSQKDNLIGDKYILLYITNNYKWYCKYKLNFNALDQSVCMKWDPEKPNILHVIANRNGVLYHHKYSWLWVINKSKTCEIESESFVAVIDGFNIYLTSFKRGIIPPPLSTYTITAPCIINSVSFASDSSNNLLLHLSNGDILIYKYLNSKTLQYELSGTLKFNNNESETYYNCQWIETNKLLLSRVKYNEEFSYSFIVIIALSDFSDTSKVLKEKQIQIKSGAAIVRATKCNVLIYDNSGKFFLLKEDEYSELNLKQNKNILELEILEKDDNLLIFSLDNSNKFFVNSKLLFNNILSFHVHDKFILLTTMKQELLCLNSDDELLSIEYLPKVFKRRIESGARLITSIQKDMKVILQMPRGNLECIQPRGLTIYKVGEYLDSLQFDQAFDLMRKQRINLNLIFDHNQVSFLNNVKIFIEQVKSPQWISLFISEITEEDVTKTMYSVAYATKIQAPNCLENKSKIDVICGLIENYLLESKNSENFVLPILTCHIKRNKIEFLEKALLILKNLKLREDQGEKLLVSFREAFKYMLYLIDVEEIFKIALGMYDFDLVLLVASNSQKDPKEYLPFLNDLKKLEPHYQKFTIDKYLKRYQKALTNLILCDEEDHFNECLNFIRKHQLYRTALKLIPQNTERFRRLCLYYGEDLMLSNMFEEAGIMFFNARMYRNAMDAYKRSGNWHEILNCAKELELESKELNDLYLDIANDLIQSNEFAMASTIYLDYLKEVENGVKILANGKLYAEACRISLLHNKPDLIHRIIVPSVMQQANLIISQIAEFKNTFAKQTNRLQIVRKEKLQEVDQKFGTEIDSDIYSEASTVITRSHATSKGTNRTYRSAKNRRKQERKLLSLKEGSPYEHLALIISLHNLVTKCLALMPEVKEINKFLIKINEYEIAENLQKDLEELLEKIEYSKTEIWIPELLNNKTQTFGSEATSNEIAATYMKTDIVPYSLLEPKYAIPPEVNNKFKWKLEIVKS